MSQITTHILDTALGCPATGVSIQLSQQVDGDWQEVGGGVTNSDGRVPDLCPQGQVLDAGVYRMHFAIMEMDPPQTRTFALRGPDGTVLYQGKALSGFRRPGSTRPSRTVHMTANC